MSTLNTRIEEKLYQNRYVVDAGKPHIKLKELPVPSEALRSMITTCPASCYSENEQGKIEIAPDGCVECGTCRVVCAGTGEIEWNYPRGGYGVLFKFG